MNSTRAYVLEGTVFTVKPLWDRRPVFDTGTCETIAFAEEITCTATGKVTVKPVGWSEEMREAGMWQEVPRYAHHVLYPAKAA